MSTIPSCWVASLLFCALISLRAQTVEVRLSGDQFQLHYEVGLAPLAGLQAKVHVEGSRNLIDWEVIRDSQLESIDPGEPLNWSFPVAGDYLFFRLFTESRLESLKDPGAEVLGYGAAFRRQLGQIGQISPEDLLQRYPPPDDYLRSITWDPTTAQFWELFNTDPAVHNAALPANDPERRSYDFRLNEAEMALFKQQGFVVSERLGAWSFAEIFYRLFIDDLPVFVSADAILQAWHRSYASLLQEFEATILFYDLELILSKSAAELAELGKAHASENLRPALHDADYFLAVALSLLRGTNVPTQFAQDTKVAETLAQIKREAIERVELFGSCRRVDFSQFKPRGHYENSPLLRRYFQAMMWLGRTDFRVAEPLKDSTCPVVDPFRELAGAIVLQLALENSGAFPVWEAFDKVLQVFVGWSDSMNFAQLRELLLAAGIDSLEDIAAPSQLEQLQTMIANGTLGLQQIRGDLFLAPVNQQPIKLPRSFTFIGQRFTPDSWVMSQVVFDSILWKPSPDLPLENVQRRMPSGLDVAFAVLGNNAATPEIVRRIQDQNGEPFRDGLPYQHNLAAARAVIDRQTDESWESTVYLSWLGALRKLSEPTTAEVYPQFMRTEGWAGRNLHRQLASWTHLRHDTVLYVKQSYTSFTLCSYPAGYVEPVPAFWQSLEAAAAKMAALLRSLRPLPSPQQEIREFYQNKQAAFLEYFASTVQKLRLLAEKELAQEPFNEEEESFLENLVENMTQYAGIRQFSGWYPRLFYRSVTQDGYTFHTINGSDRWDALIVDVHSNPPDWQTGDLGGILHQAVGNVFLLMTAVDNGPDRMIYAGPVLSYYEIKEPWPKRKTDQEWKQQIRDGTMPPHPDWTKPFLVPGQLTLPRVAYE